MSNQLSNGSRSKLLEGMPLVPNACGRQCLYLVQIGAGPRGSALISSRIKAGSFAYREAKKGGQICASRWVYELITWSTSYKVAPMKHSIAASPCTCITCSECSCSNRTNRALSGRVCTTWARQTRRWLFLHGSHFILKLLVSITDGIYDLTNFPQRGLWSANRTAEVVEMQWSYAQHLATKLPWNLNFLPQDGSKLLLALWCTCMDEETRNKYDSTLMQSLSNRKHPLALRAPYNST